MFIYEKNGKLNVQFGAGQIPAETPDMIIEKGSIKVEGKELVPEEAAAAEKNALE